MGKANAKSIMAYISHSLNNLSAFNICRSFSEYIYLHLSIQDKTVALPFVSNEQESYISM